MSHLQCVQQSTEKMLVLFIYLYYIRNVVNIICFY